MKKYITLFLKWIYEDFQITPEEYALNGLNQIKYRFEYEFPFFDELINSCYDAINLQQFDDETIEDILTVMAFDNESESILDYLITRLTSNDVIRFAEIGIQHKLYEARWQVAELLCRRRPKGYKELLCCLSNDSNSYVRQRANNAIGYE